MQPRSVADVRDCIEAHALQQVRVSFSDQHGILHTKTVGIDQFGRVCENGLGVPSSLLLKDSGNAFALSPFAKSGSSTFDALVGARDMVLRPDLSTFRALPWVTGTGWVLCDLTTEDGNAIEVSTREILRRSIDDLAQHGRSLTVGLEFEFHLYDESGEPIHPGWNLLAEHLADRAHERVEPIRNALTALGLAPLSIEVELGPGQIEMSFAPAPALAAADHAVLIRSAIAQVARRNGMRASFLCRPANDAFTSGWHLHQSIVDDTGRNVCGDADGSLSVDAPSVDALSVEAQQWTAGLLEHARESCMLTTPTVNGYRRYRPGSVVPDRVAWDRQHRGAMIRVVGTGESTHLENRVGDPMANPYLYVASQIVSGLDGVRCARVLPGSLTDGGSAGTLPPHLGAAIEAFDQAALYRRCWGDETVDYLVALKRSEWGRFNANVSEWEQTEYGRWF